MAFLDNFERYPMNQLYLCNTYLVEKLEHFDSNNPPKPRGTCMSKKILYGYVDDDRKTLIDPITQQLYYGYNNSNPVGTFYYRIITPLSDLDAFSCSLFTSVSLSKIKKLDKILSKNKK